MGYPKTKEYLECIYNFWALLSKKAENTQDKKLGCICRMILNYILKSMMETRDTPLCISGLQILPDFSMKPMKDYIQTNQIVLLDLHKIVEGELDSTQELDVERYVLSHLYYIYSRNVIHTKTI